MDSKILEIVQSLIEADKAPGEFRLSSVAGKPRRGGYPSIIPYNHSDAAWIIDHFSESDVRHLLRALVLYSSRSWNSVSPVNPIYLLYVARYPAYEAELTAWIVEHRVNIYDPFGTVMHSESTSYSEFRAARSAQKVRATNSEAESQRRHEDKLARLAAKATKDLPNAVRRGDLKAVEALLAKGADPVKASVVSGSLRLVAEENGHESIVVLLAKHGIIG